MNTHHPSSLPRFIRSLDLRNARITRFAPILLFLLVASAGFGGARAFGTWRAAVGEAEMEHRQLAVRAQNAVDHSQVGGKAAWIFSGHDDGAGSGAQMEPLARGADLRRHERRESEGGADQHHLSALLALASAGSSEDRTEVVLRRAETKLATALSEEPDRAAAWSDLAAVYLTWASRLDRPRLYIDAFAATHSALEIEPNLAEAKLNQALALEQLGLFQEAADLFTGSWPSWVDPEAMARKRDVLSALDPVALNEEVIDALEQAAEAGDRATFAETADQFPPTVERWVEEVLLPRWAEAVEIGDFEKAGIWLELSRMVGDRLAEGHSRPDAMLRDTVAAIDRAAGEAEVLDGLVRGHRAFGFGMRAFPERLAEARQHFEQAALAFEESGTPFMAWARFYLGACRHMQRDLSGAMAEFDRLRGEGELYPGMEVRRGWGRGLIFNHLNEIRSALDTYRPARELAIEHGDLESAAAIAYQEAEASNVIGSHEESWRFLVKALRVADYPVRARFRVNVLFVAAELLHPRPDLPSKLLPALKPGFAELQSLFQQQAVKDAERSNLATFIAQNRSRWATFLEAKGLIAEAERERRRAGAIVAAIADPEIRQRAQAELALGEAARGNSESSDEFLQSSLETFRHQKLDFRVVETALALAERARQRGETESQEGWLEEAQKVIEVLALSLEPMQDRFRFLAATQWVSRARIVSALDHHRDAGLALQIYLREQVLQRRAISGLPDPEGLQFGSPGEVIPLPPGSVFLVWLALPKDRLVVLALSEAGPIARELRIGTAELVSRVEEVRSSLEALRRSNGKLASTELDPPLEVLSYQLLAPIADRLPDKGILGLSLDDVFAGIPFEALSVAPGGPRLVERFLITRVSEPKVLTGEPSPLKNPRRGGLVIGASQPAPSWHLEALDAADREVAAIQQLLGLADDETLSSGDSTYSRIMSRLADARWLHFAGHALPDPYDASSSVLILAEDGDNPSSLSIQDLAAAGGGHLELAVLAGCETARSGTSGLAQALERGGVPFVIGSHWPVNDESTAKFFSEFYELLAAGVPPIQAFHQTQLAALDSKDAQLASVATWASFAVWGW